ncbi:AraC family transcriptional regulator [Meridianimarinicoccus sp. MJW13]|uniref:AraC family transcriptional regulator n=1 Tax=Meridianimarinicoccus sp. MJW13 TaxID=2720031 RepID=UPI001865FEF1|nr:AraC family transcriptional regulator [Fluviibacterium sp. MJW13]
MTHRLPLVKLSLLRPFVGEFHARGIDPEPVFDSVGLTEEATLDPDLSVHVMVATQFVENAADVANDRFLGARVGAKLDLGGWPILADAEARATTAGDYLSIFIAGANEVSSSATEYLNISGQTATLGERRTFKPTILPAQNDAFMLALGWAILQRALRDGIDPSKVTVVVSDPSVLPPEFDLMHPVKGNRMGFSIRFPTAWLSSSFDARSPDLTPMQRRDADVGEFVHSFRQVVRAYIGQGALSAADCAVLASMSQQKLKRRLAAEGTGISKEIDFVRQEYARAALFETNRSISDIATALGFTDVANFTRAFRRANDMTPTTYRSLQRTQKDGSAE